MINFGCNNEIWYERKFREVRNYNTLKHPKKINNGLWSGHFKSIDTIFLIIKILFALISG